ncbi:MAG: flagellar hook-length control protein FliK [Marinobacter sp.]|nr:flagellar hook-length control protein FliK [Marinobacter sp.]
MSATALPISLSLELPTGTATSRPDPGAARTSNGEAYEQVARQAHDRSTSATSHASNDKRPDAAPRREAERTAADRTTSGAESDDPLVSEAPTVNTLEPLASGELSGLLAADPALAAGELQDLDPDMVSTAPFKPLQAGLMEPVGTTGAPLSGGVLGENSAAAGLRVAELLGAQGDSLMGNLGGEAAKLVDIAGSANSQRFAGMFELAQQAQAKEAELVPLRGYATSVETPVGQADWGDKIMGKLAWLANQNLSVAEIHITPPDLGPLEVRVQVQNEQTSVTIHAANPGVRELLEQQSQRLRDMLADSGLNLEQFDVSDQAGQQSQRDDDASGVAVSALKGDDEGNEILAGEHGELDLSWKGELDVYA